MDNHILSSFLRYLKQTLVTVFIMSFSVSSYATMTLVSAIVEGNNDCTGGGKTGAYFSTGKGFWNCEVLLQENGSIIYQTEADVIAKFDGNLDIESQDTDAWGNWADTVTFSNVTSSTGDWSTTSATPGIKFWSSKSTSSDLKLFWWVDSAQVTNSGPCYDGTDSQNFIKVCLELAQTVISGSRATSCQGL